MSKRFCPICHVEIDILWSVEGCHGDEVIIGVCKEHGAVKPILEEKQPMIIGHAGDKAYLDGISGMVPCIVLKVTPEEVLVRMDAKKGVLSWHGIQEYGDWNEEVSWTHNQVVPERAVRWPDGKNSFHPRIMPYKWEVTS